MRREGRGCGDERGGAGMGKGGAGTGDEVRWKGVRGWEWGKGCAEYEGFGEGGARY